MLYENIALLLAGQSDESALIAEAMRIVGALEAHLTVIHINDPNAGMGHMMPDTNPKMSRKDMLKEFIEAGYGPLLGKVQLQLPEGKPFFQTILEAVGGADLLIMGHHHKNLFKRLLVHGTDEKVADQIQCPVLLVPFSAD